MSMAGTWRSQSAPSLRDTAEAERQALAERAHEEVQRHRESQQQMRRTLREALDRQLAAKSHLPALMQHEKEQARKENTAVVEQVANEAKRAQEQQETMRRTLCEGLDRQVAQNAQLAKESRLREKMAADDDQARLLKQLSEDMRAHNRKRRQLKRVNDDVKAKMEAKRNEAAERLAQQLREGEQFRGAMEREAQAHDDRIMAEKERLKAMSAGIDHRVTIAAPFFEEERKRREKEEARWARDALDYSNRLDQHYARREAARVRQHHGMSECLDLQVEATRRKKDVEELQKKAELQDVRQSTRSHLETELAAAQQKKVAQKALRQELVQQIVERSQRPNSGARLSAGLNTMYPNATMLALVSDGASASAGGAKAAKSDMLQRMDASKHLMKPLGRPHPERSSSQVDLHRISGLGGVVGIFGGEGSFRSAMAATQGAERQLAAHTHIAKRDKFQSASWSHGLTQEEVRGGMRAAALRGSASAADKSLVDPIVGPPSI